MTLIGEREKSRNSKYAAGHLIYILGAQLRLVVYVELYTGAAAAAETGCV